MPVERWMVDGGWWWMAVARGWRQQDGLRRGCRQILVRLVVALCHGRSSLLTGQWMEGWDGMGWDGKWMMD